MKHIFTAFALLLLAPNVTFAVGSAQAFIENSTFFVANTLIPFLLAIAFLALVFNVFKYFFVGAENAEAQQTARRLALYSVAAFVFFVIFWGVINLLVDSIGLSRETANVPDYIDRP